MAQELPQLGTPEVTAVTEDFRENIKVSWKPVPNAQQYIVRFTQNGDVSHFYPGSGQATVDGLMHTFSNVHPFIHNTVYVTAIASGYANSVQTSVIATPRKLISESFVLDITLSSLRVTWVTEYTFIPGVTSDEEADAAYKGRSANLFFTIEDPNGNLIVDDLKLSTKDATREFLGLDEDTNYKLRIVLGAFSYAQNDTSVVKGEALEIQFKTLGTLSVPTGDQITWLASDTSLAVGWFAAPEGVTTYDLTLTGEGSSIPTIIEVDARMQGGTIFSQLTAGTTYTLGAVAKGDASLYAPSPEYRVPVMTRLSVPDITLSIQSSRDIVVSWPRITDATNYTVNLYLGNDRETPINGPIAITGTTHTFNGLTLDLKFGTGYTVGVIAQADNVLNSFEGFGNIETDRFILSAPMGISLSETINSITVRWSSVNSELKIESYLLSIDPDPAGDGEQTIPVSANDHTFTGLSFDREYEVSVISSRDETGYIQSSVHRAPTRTAQLPQLDAPTGLAASAITGNSISLSWSLVTGATTFDVAIYNGDNTNAMALETLTILQSGANNSASFGMLNPAAQYTIVVIAHAENHRNSAPATLTRMTARQQLETPTATQIVVIPSTVSVTINFESPSMGVDGYVLSIVGVAAPFTNIADLERFSSDDSPHVFDVLPGRAYNLTAQAYGEDALYINSEPYNERITTEPVDALANLTTVTAVIEARRQDAATVFDIRIAWGSVTNAQDYTVNIYATGGIRVTRSVPAAATRTVFENYPYSQFSRVGVTAVSVIYPNSQEAFASVLPPKLSSAFFTVTPSAASLSLAWDSSPDADLQDGINFHDATHINNLGSSASSLLLISIEELSEEIIAPMEVSTEEGTYSTDGLSEETDYILKIVQRVTIGNASLESEALEISFRTLKELPKPTDNQINWAAGETTLTVRWENAATGVTDYDLTLTREGASIESIEVDARMSDSTIFSDLDPGVAYTLSVNAKGDTSLYAPSPEYRVSVETSALARLNDPEVMLLIQSSRNIVVSWGVVTNATNYTVNLYLGNNRETSISGPIDTAGTTHTFENLSFGTGYTVGVIAEADNAPNSNEGFNSIETDSFILSTPMDISLSETINSITVRWSMVEPGLNIESYLLSIDPDPAEDGERTIPVSANEHTFTGLSADSEYTVSVVSSRDETGYIQSSVYRAPTRTAQLPQLETLVIFDAVSFLNDITFSWRPVSIVTTYKISLYLGDDTSGEALRSINRERNDGPFGRIYQFTMLEPATQYTVEIIVQAEDYIESAPATTTAISGKQQLERPTAHEIAVEESTDSATITFQDPPMGVTGYRLTVGEAFGNRREILRGTDFSLGESPVFVDNLSPGQRYFLIVRPTFDTNRYIEPTSNFGSNFDTDTVDALANPTMVTAAIEARRQDTATVFDIRVRWASAIANAENYAVRLYAGANSNADTPIGNPIEVPPTATMVVFEDYPYSQFYTVGVRAVSDVYPDSGEERTSVLPAKLSSAFFTVTPSAASLSLAWDSSSDAGLQDGINFYDATRVDNLGSSASSLLLISIEESNGDRTIAPMEVSGGSNAYSTDGLSEETDYILKIVQRVTIGSASLESEALEIPFRTLKELPEPTDNQIDWIEDGITLTVSWENVREGVSSYVLTLARTEGDTAVGEPIEVDARTPSTTTFSNLDPEISYTLSVVAKGDTSSYTPSSPYRVNVVTSALDQLILPEVMLLIQSSRNIVVSWNEVMNATNYTVNLYSGNDRSNPISGPIATTGTTHTFNGLTLDLKFGTGYTVGVIAEADNAPNSNERFRSIETDSFILSTPMDISLSETTKSITVRWSSVNSELKIESYLLSIDPDPAGDGEQTIPVSANDHTFTGLSFDREYEVSVISSRDETGYIQSSVHRAPTRTAQLLQLDAPTRLNTREITANSFIALGDRVLGATDYKFNLYLGNDRSTIFRTLTTRTGPGGIGTVQGTFNMLLPGTLYTIELIVEADNYRDSAPITATAMTAKQQLETPTATQIVVIPSTVSVTINFESPPMGVDGYVLSIVGVAAPFTNIANLERFSSDDSPHVFDVLPGRAYNLTAQAYGEDALYINSEPYNERITTESVDALANPTMVTAAIEARRQDTASDIRVAWGPVTNAQSYTVSIYPGAGNVDGISALSTKTVPAIDTTTVFENYPSSQFLTVGVRAVSVIYPNSQEVFASVLPAKLSSGFFTVTPSFASLSLAWDSSSDADLQDGVNFYDATRVDNLGNSASSLLLISIEESNGDRRIDSMEVSGGSNTYSADGLSEETDYILKIVQRVTIDSASLESEVLEIPFRTLKELPEPTEDQIKWAAGETTLTVSWDNVPEGVSSYVLTLTREGAVTGAPKEVDARMPGSTPFNELTAGTSYALSVVAKGVPSLFVASPQYRTTVTTNMEQLLAPEGIAGTIESEVNKVNIVVTWDEVSNAQKYEIKLYDAENTLLSDRTTETLSSNTRSHTFSSLLPASVYTVGIVAQAENYRDSNEGRSAEIRIARVTLEDVTGGQNIMTSSITAGSITLSWDGNDVPDNVIYYVFEIIDGGNFTDIGKIEVGTEVGTYKFAGLDPDRTYTIEVTVRGNTAFYNDSNTAFEIQATTRELGLRLRLRAFLEGPLQ